MLAVLASPRALVLEWLEAGPEAAKGADALGRGLAALHRAASPGRQPFLPRGFFGDARAMSDPPLYDARLDRALAFAADAFRERPRKATRVPYLSHLLAVTALVMENGGSEDACIAAVLHDYLEDVPGA